MANKTVKVSLRADVANYVQGMQAAAKQTDALTRGAENIDQWGDRWSGAAEKVGGQMLIAGAAVAAGTALTVKSAMDWESAWTGVLKTVDGTPAQLSAVEQGLRDMTSVLPASHAEIAAVAEAAGQLGIETPNVVAFTRTMIDLGETTNLSAEQAATQLARFMNIMGTSQGDVDRLGSAIVGLGNNFASTESEILDMAMRLAGAGAQIGMSEGDVLGLATALSSVGIEAEAGGSAMSKVMIDIAASVDEGGDRLEQFAQVAGLSADEFAAKWATDPAAALQTFIQGLADAESQGSSTLGILADLGITEIRMRDALLRASSAASGFGDAVAMGNTAFEENIALQQEAELRYGTTESKLGILQNRLTDAAITLGAQLLPALEAVMDGIGFFADGLAGLDGPMASVVAWGSVAAAALLLAGGGFLTLVPKIVATNVALQTLGINAGKSLGSLKNLFSLKGGIAITALWAALEVGKFALDAVTQSSEEAQTALKNSASGADVLTAALSRTTSIGEVFGWRDDAREASELLADLPARIENASGAWYEIGQRGRDDVGAFKLLSEELRNLAATDAPAAASAFAQLAASLPDEQLVQFMDLMPEWTNSLADQAAGLGIVEGAVDTYEEKLALANWALEGMPGSVNELTGEIEGQATAADQAAAAVEGLADAIRAYDDLMSGLVNAEIGFRQAIDDVNEALGADGFVATLDLSTQAGRDNMSALDDLAQSTTDWAAQLQESGGTMEEVTGAIQEGRDAFVTAAEAMGLSTAEAEALADQYGLIPDTVKTEFESNMPTTSEQLQGILDQIGELNGPGIPPIIIEAMTDDAKTELENLGLTVTQLDDGTWSVEFSADPTEAEEQLAQLEEYINGSGGTVTVDGDSTPATGTVSSWQDAANATVAIPKVDADAAEARGEVLAWKLEADGTWSVSHMDAEKAQADDKVITWKRDANGTWTTSHMGAEAQAAYNKLNGFESDANGTRPVVQVDANTSAARTSINGLGNMTVTIMVDAIRRYRDANANGGLYSYGLSAFANGGYGTLENPYRSLPSGIYAGGLNIHKFAEPETGFEAYISGKRGMEHRNLAILEDVQSRLLRQLGQTRAFATGGGFDYQAARAVEYQPRYMMTAGAVAAGGLTITGPLVSVGQMVVDSDTRVQEVSQDLFRRADQAARAQGKVTLGGAIA
ncbi:phage tail tape measure protein [Gulosibacter sediminis]|uniref:phage tail tape measure protein n=1 Tax=Gulosibacter sediminis TaxID=1729695 RepID=UPI0024A842A6|nr:phage tail tape measure protein [Gulosibacter sediminis]